MIKENYNASAMRQLSDESLVKHTDQKLDDILTAIDREARRGGSAIVYQRTTYRFVHEVNDAPLVDDQALEKELRKLGYKITSRNEDREWVISW